jgi:hypothetical protein
MASVQQSARLIIIENVARSEKKKKKSIIILNFMQLTKMRNLEI